MQLDDWTVLGAVVAPYAPYLLVAWEKNRLGVYDPANPRDSNAVLEGWSARAKAAELNSWEALTAYLAFGALVTLGTTLRMRLCWPSAMASSSSLC